MKHSLLIWSGLWRKPSRTVLVFLSTVVAFVLFGLLEGVGQGVNSLADTTNSHRLWVLSSGGSRDSLPIAQLGKIEGVPGVQRVVAVTAMRAYFQERKNGVAGTATDADAFFDVFPELQVDPQQLKAMRETRNGVLVGSLAAARFGWKPGDRIALGSSWLKRDGTNNWEFDVVGTFAVAPSARRDPMANALTFRVLMNYPYLDEGRAFRNGTVSQYFVRTNGSASTASVGSAIEALFANSSDQTLAQSEAAGLSGPIKQLADLDIIVIGICGAALFSLLLLAGNTMMQSVHERVAEFAVLKTLGYTDRAIFLLVVIELLTVFAVAAPVGLLIAWFVMPSATAGFGTVIRMPLAVFGWGLLIAAALAIVCALPPALRANRLRIVDALANR